MQPRALPFEMLRPDILTRTKQPDHLACHWINSCHIGPLVHVAGKARPRKIPQNSGTTMLLRDDVICVKRKIRDMLRQPTVLATARSLRDYLPFMLAGRSRHNSCSSLLEREARPGLHQFQGASCFLEAREFVLFCFVQFCRLGFLQEDTHPFPIIRRE